MRATDQRINRQLIETNIMRKITTKLGEITARDRIERHATSQPYKVPQLTWWQDSAAQLATCRRVEGLLISLAQMPAQVSLRTKRHALASSTLQGKRLPQPPLLTS